MNTKVVNLIVEGLLNDKETLRESLRLMLTAREDIADLLANPETPKVNAEKLYRYIFDNNKDAVEIRSFAVRLNSDFYWRVYVESVFLRYYATAKDAAKASYYCGSEKEDDNYRYAGYANKRIELSIIKDIIDD